MKITTKIEKACSTDKTRKPIHNPYFDGKNLYATDGHVMACIPAEELELGDLVATPGYIPLQAIADSRKAQKYLKGIVLLDNAEKVQLPSGVEYPRNPGQEQFPNVLLSNDKFAIEAVEERHISIYIDAEKLWNLVQALGIENNARLDIPIKTEVNLEKNRTEVIPVLGGIRVRPSRSKEHKQVWGVLMPLNGSKG